MQPNWPEPVKRRGYTLAGALRAFLEAVTNRPRAAPAERAGRRAPALESSHRPRPDSPVPPGLPRMSPDPTGGLIDRRTGITHPNSEGNGSAIPDRRFFCKGHEGKTGPGDSPLSTSHVTRSIFYSEVYRSRAGVPPEATRGTATGGAASRLRPTDPPGFLLSPVRRRLLPSPRAQAVEPRSKVAAAGRPWWFRAGPARARGLRAALLPARPSSPHGHRRAGTAFRAEGRSALARRWQSSTGVSGV